MKRIILNILAILIISTPASFAQLQPSLSNNGTVDAFRGNIQFFLVRAENLFRQGNHLDALLELDNAVGLAPQNPEVYLHRAMMKYRLGMSNEAQQDAAMATRLSPIAPALFGMNGPQAQMDLLAFYPEELYQKISWNQRLEYYETTLDNWYTNLNSAEVTDDLPELESIVIHFEEVLVALQNKAFDRALEELAIIELFKENTSVVYDLKGLIYLETAELESAATAFRKAINLDPNNAMAWFNFSKISQHLGEYQASLDFLNKALGLNPNFSEAYFERALVKKKLGDLDGAVIDYTKVIEKEENTFLTAYFNRAICFKKMGRLNAALKDLDYALEYEPDNSLSWKVRGNINLLSGRHNEAIADFTKAIDLNSELGMAYFNRGIAHLLNYNPITACVDFERSADEGYDRATDKQRYFCNN